MRHRIVISLGFVVVLLFIIFVRPAFAGGWATVMLEHLPEQINAGETISLSVIFRQHGHTPIDGLALVLKAEHDGTGRTVHFDAKPGDSAGRYVFAILLPEAGTWRWWVSGWGGEKFPMPDLHVQAAQAPDAKDSAWSDLGLLLASGVFLSAGVYFISNRWSQRVLVIGLASTIIGIACLAYFGVEHAIATSSPDPMPTQAFAERGADLFVAKGCTACHTHRRVEARYVSFSTGIGPDLTDYSGSEDYLRIWLDDPKKLKPETLMPDLELSEDEISAIAKFLVASE